MPLPTYYAIGTASVANGTTTISFGGAVLGTADDPTIQSGDTFVDPAQPLVPPQRINSVDYDASTATLSTNWPGTSMTADPYEVRYVGDSVRSTAQTRRLLTLLTQISNTGIEINAFGEFVDLSTYDSQTAGYVFLSLNGDAGATTSSAAVFIKASNGVGDWSDPIPVQGPTGPSGGDRYDLAFWDPARATNGETVGEHIFTTAVSFALNLAESQGNAAVAATATAVWSLQKNGVQFATATFAASGSTATFSGTATSFAAGDVLSLVAPTPRDATLSDVKFTITGNR